MYLDKYYDIKIRELEENDIESLTIFLMEIYQIDLSYKDELIKHYYWKYICNYEVYPFIKSLIAVDHNKIVGFLGLGNYELRINNVTKKACWVMDWMTIKSTHTKGLGTFLLSLAINNSNHVHVTATELSPTAEKIFLKFGFRKYEVGQTITMYSFKSIMHLGKKKLIKLLTFKIKALILNQFRQINTSIFFKESKVSELKFNKQQDGNNRNAMYLNWLLSSNEFGGKICRIFDNEVEIGYCVYNQFFRKNEVIIRVLDFSIPKEYFKSMIDFIKLSQKKVDIVEIKVANHFCDYLSKYGYYKSPNFFWAQDHLELNHQNFSPSFCDKDAAYRGVNNII